MTSAAVQHLGAEDIAKYTALEWGAFTPNVRPRAGDAPRRSGWLLGRVGRVPGVRIQECPPQQTWGGHSPYVES